MHRFSQRGLSSMPFVCPPHREAGSIFLKSPSELRETMVRGLRISQQLASYMLESWSPLEISFSKPSRRQHPAIVNGRDAINTHTRLTHDVISGAYLWFSGGNDERGVIGGVVRMIRGERGEQEDSWKLSARDYVFIIRRTISLVSKWRLRFMFVSWRRLTGACSCETPADVRTERLQNCDTNLTNVDEMTTLHAQKFCPKSAFQASKRGFRIKNQRFSPIPPAYAILCRGSVCRTSKKLFIFVEYNHPTLTTHKTY